jgi:hypothetical protein
LQSSHSWALGTNLEATTPMMLANFMDHILR